MTCWKIWFSWLILASLSISLTKPKPAGSESGEYVSTPLTEGNYKKILKHHKYVFIKFYTPWCVFCKQIYDIWELVGEKFQDQPGILIADIDCGAHKPICQSFNVREYPMLLMFRDGKRFEKYIGPRTSKDIINYVKRFLMSRKLRDK